MVVLADDGVAMVFHHALPHAPASFNLAAARVGESALQFMVVQDQVSLFYWMREWSGVVFLIGLICYIVSFFVGGEKKAA